MMILLLYGPIPPAGVPKVEPLLALGVMLIEILAIGAAYAMIRMHSGQDD